MKNLHEETDFITQVILEAKKKAYSETSSEPEPGLTSKIKWPVDCKIGPGLEGAIACETEIGYVNGSKGWLIYQGYDIFDLCAYSTFEEVSYLLLHGKLPSKSQLEKFKEKLSEYRSVADVQRLLMSFRVEKMNTMAALRLGTNFMRQMQTYRDEDIEQFDENIIATDEDSIPMETVPTGDKKAIYEFKTKTNKSPRKDDDRVSSEELESGYHLIAGISSIAASIARLRQGKLPIEHDPELGHAANMLYMMTGKKPTPLEERVMDVCLILHADHGMNASTFSSMVVASTLSDIYFAIGSGIAALNGPLHGGANEKVMDMLEKIKDPSNVKSWYDKARKKGQKVMGFGHRVYKAYDPRARILGPLAEKLASENPKMANKFKIASLLEKEVVADIGKEKKTFPNVDFYSGIVYETLNIPSELYTPLFAVSRVSGWCARVLEYLRNDRIFRPRGIYIGEFNKEFKPINDR